MVVNPTTKQLQNIHYFIKGAYANFLAKEAFLDDIRWVGTWSSMFRFANGFGLIDIVTQERQTRKGVPDRLGKQSRRLRSGHRSIRRGDRVFAW